jgi:hypothetical protein
MQTLDLRSEFKHLYRASAKKIELIDVPQFQFVMIDGSIKKGEAPSTSPGFSEATHALYGIAYTLKFMLKQRKVDPIDYPVMALEGLWWVEDGFFDIKVKDNWFYTLMILQPGIITSALFEEGLAQLAKKRGDSPSPHRLRLETFTEGLCVQTLHIGPYSTEPMTIEKMHAFMKENDLSNLVGAGGKHHEIYMGDPRKSAPEKLKTILRLPVKRNS